MALLLLSGSFSASGAQGAEPIATAFEAAPASCQRVELSREIELIASMVEAAPNRVEVIDFVHKEALTIDLATGHVSSEQAARGHSLPLVRARLGDQGAIVDMHADYSRAIFEVQWYGNREAIDQETSPTKTRIVLDEAGERRVLGIYDYTLVDGQHLFAIGALDSGLGSYGQAAFFSHELLTPDKTDSEIYRRLIEPFEDIDYYLLGYPYMASVGKNAYFLKMVEGQAELWRYNVEAVTSSLPVEGIAKELLTLPDLEKATHPDPFHGLKVVERSSMPAGLYSDGESLFLLHRSPDPQEKGATIWTLHKYHVGNDEEASLEPGDVLTLPSRTAHLRLLPMTDGRWVAFEQNALDVERGPDGRIADWAAPTSSLLELPKAWIEDPSSAPREPSCQ